MSRWGRGLVFEVKRRVSVYCCDIWRRKMETTKLVLFVLTLHILNNETLKEEVHILGNMLIGFLAELDDNINIRLWYEEDRWQKLMNTKWVMVPTVHLLCLWLCLCLWPSTSQPAQDVPLGHLESHGNRGYPGDGCRQAGDIRLHVAQQLLQLLQHWERKRERDKEL